MLSLCRPWIAMLMVLACLAVAPAAAGAATCPDGRTVSPTMEGLPDHQLSGNRVVFACAPLRGAWRDLELDAVPTWVVAHPIRPGSRWVVVDNEGTVSESSKGRLTELGRLEPGEAPYIHSDRGRLVIHARSERSGRAPAVPGARPVGTGFTGASLAEPTDRYRHGALGDDIEAGALRIWTDDGSTPLVTIEPPAVIEGISPIAAGFGSGPGGFLVTVSDEVVGARLRAYDEYGHVIAESEPMGQGFRWLHQIGVGPTGPAGEIEVIAVRTPHIEGTVEAYRKVGDRFERVAAIEGYSSHAFGSADLDMALLADVDADGRLEVIVPTPAMTELAVLRRTTDGFEEIDRLPLDGRLASNVAAAVDRQGRLRLAAATDDGRLRVFR